MSGRAWVCSLAHAYQRLPTVGSGPLQDKVICDDYLRNSEMVVDYLTRYSLYYSLKPWLPQPRSCAHRLARHMCARAPSCSQAIPPPLPELTTQRQSRS